MATQDSEPDSVASFALGGVTYFVRWHPDDAAMDAVVRADGGHWAFPELASCLAAWLDWDPEAHTGRLAADCDTVIRWLSGQAFKTPAADLLSVWNFAGDVARGVGVPWHDRGRLRDQVYEKLTGASLPWLNGREHYVPRWSPREIVALRRIATEAVALIRAAVR